MIKRHLADKIKQLAGKYPVISISGPRQSGKTTLIKNLFPKFKYISLEDIKMRELAQNDPKGFLKNYPTNTIFDEAQRVPELFSYIQSIIKSSSKSKFIISSSQSLSLTKKVVQSLEGKVAFFKLLPFTFNELEDSKLKFTDFESYIYSGFYPRIYDKKIHPKEFYENYLQTYVERDVRLIKNISNLDDFMRFLKLCAANLGQLLNYTSLANDCGVSVNTAKTWISILESSYITFTLEPYPMSFNKRVVKMPKLYFYDTGLASSLLGIENKYQVSTHYSKGLLFENLIISDLIKTRNNSAKNSNIFFWRDSKGNEINCLIKKENELIPVDIKSGQTISDYYFNNLNYWKKIAKDSPDSTVIYAGDKSLETSKGYLMSWKDINKLSF